jgi:hypothetical protein
MTTDTALDILRRATSPMSAQAIAQHLGLTVEETYVQLVRAEAQNKARVTPAVKALETNAWRVTDYHRMAWELGANG